MKSRATIGLIMLTACGSAFGAVIVLKTFDDLCGGYNLSQSVKMPKGDNLMYCDLDPNTVDSPVGLDLSYWHFGYVDFDGPDAYFVGWGRNSGYLASGKSGYISGVYTEYLLFDPEKKPDEVYIVRDKNRDGPGTFDTSNGTWTLGSDDSYYTSQDVLFGPNLIRGDISLLPAVDLENLTVYLPKMVMKPFSDLDDYVSMSEFWLCDCNEGNLSCEGQDWNSDGRVDLSDFSILATKWLKYP